MGGEQKFIINNNAVTFIAKKLKRPGITNYLSKFKSEKIYNREELEGLLGHVPFSSLCKQHQDTIRTGLAIGALRSKIARSSIHFTISDDAPNFVRLTKNHQLCWVHEIRKYKLCEVFKRIESETLEKLVQPWRTFYGHSLEFKCTQTRELRLKVRSEFKRICSIKTLVKPLDNQLKRTWENREGLLF